jgi:hypothetical protein
MSFERSSIVVTFAGMHKQQHAGIRDVKRGFDRKKTFDVREAFDLTELASAIISFLHGSGASRTNVPKCVQSGDNGLEAYTTPLRLFRLAGSPGDGSRLLHRSSLRDPPRSDRRGPVGGTVRPGAQRGALGLAGLW